MEDTANWLKKKITPTESIISSSGISTKPTEGGNDVQESTEVVTPIIKKQTKVEEKPVVIKKSGKPITIPNVAVIGEDFKIDFDKEYNYVEVTISNGIRWEVPNAVWNAGGEEEEIGSPLIEFFQESEVDKWSTVSIPIKSTQTVHGKEINILKPEEILIEVYIKINNEEYRLHEKVQLVEN